MSPAPTRLLRSVERDEGEVTVGRPADEASALVLRATEDPGIRQFSQRACAPPLSRRRGVARRLDGENGLGRELAQDAEDDGIAARDLQGSAREPGGTR